MLQSSHVWGFPLRWQHFDKQHKEFKMNKHAFSISIIAAAVMAFSSSAAFATSDVGDSHQNQNGQGHESHGNGNGYGHNKGDHGNGGHNNPGGNNGNNGGNGGSGGSGGAGGSGGSGTGIGTGISSSNLDANLSAGAIAGSTSIAKTGDSISGAVGTGGKAEAAGGAASAVGGASRVGDVKASTGPVSQGVQVSVAGGGGMSYTDNSKQTLNYLPAVPATPSSPTPSAYVAQDKTQCLPEHKTEDVEINGLVIGVFGNDGVHLFNVQRAVPVLDKDGWAVYKQRVVTLPDGSRALEQQGSMISEKTGIVTVSAGRNFAFGWFGQNGGGNAGGGSSSGMQVMAVHQIVYPCTLPLVNLTPPPVPPAPPVCKPKDPKCAETKLVPAKALVPAY